ncbi:helix-turn-helix transcriptional regulator [Phototrophicus methaneseepsis]|uniref:Helix-turn-helix transcriptional regulator n=1 Tax=Phototrophicus methaneseepsis TaxID=2710758 RepID=A0A7S8ICI9_9CHLR|nr:helix-turn-helix transcriptional regulator [Phototrophicus methaneseepsis]QPC80536.1 helix-turn-helix transcriptional regulator [Phototrophicus methaneseepsis]
MTIGRLIKEARNQRGISQRTLADLIGVSTRTLVRIENSERIPTDDMIFNLAKCLRLDARQLIQLCEGERGIASFVEPICETRC